MIMSSEHLSEENLLSELEQAGKAVEVGGLYAHYRNPNSHYKVTSLVIIEATQEVGVIYHKVSGTEAIQSITWIRPISSWLEMIDVGNSLVHRFQKVSE